MKTLLKITGFVISLIVMAIMIIPMYFWFDIKYGIKQADQIAKKILKYVYAKELQ